MPTLLRPAPASIHTKFAEVMEQTLQLQHGVVTMIGRLHSAGTELSLKGWKLGGSARILLLAGWCLHRMASTDKTVHETIAIDLRDASLSESEAVQLAELMRRQPRLTSVDVRGNEGIGKVGAEALAQFIESNVGVGVIARSVRAPPAAQPCAKRQSPPPRARLHTAACALARS